MGTLRAFGLMVTAHPPTLPFASTLLSRRHSASTPFSSKHIKVEPARWFFHADQLSLLVFRDMPAMRTDGTPSTSDKANFEDGLQRMINQLRGITLIVRWIPFNEGWGECVGLGIHLSRYSRA
ncbi:hypothetical protein C8J57DRAFT_154233 [Mycena rebaudengoi]|nr:hypothetical protein C8J57DRAFT_154233 [Mycena rebaudengoi]